MLNQIEIAKRYPCFTVKILAHLGKLSLCMDDDDGPNSASFLITKFIDIFDISGYRLIFSFNMHTSKTEILAQYIGAVFCYNEYPCICHGNSCCKSWNELLIID